MNRFYNLSLDRCSDENGHGEQSRAKASFRWLAAAIALVLMLGFSLQDVVAQCQPNTISESVYFNEINSAHDPDLQEFKEDAGGMMHTTVFADLLNGFSLSSWQNPVPYSDIVTTDFTWTDTLQEGRMCYTDDPNNLDITYDYRRYEMLGDNGVVFFPDGFLDSPIPCVNPPHRKVDIFIGWSDGRAAPCRALPQGPE